DINSLKKFWNSLGAEVDVITPEEHDSILAFTSHLPHIAAYALAGLMESKYKKYASTGFKDTTRIASSDPVLWSDIFMSNRDNTLLAIKQFKEVVSRIENKIRENLKDDLKGELKSCKEKRDELV
ncbi:MAG: prephenate dehydrogenase, partial [Candidatus Omnitrophica bacterium]|nr:prephenate dehydrogenase [Candidatus Omnitrophota bacterium]